MEIKEEKFVYPVEALESLEKVEEDKMTHEQKIAHENLSRHTKIRDTDTLNELNEELKEIDSLKEKHRYKVLEVLPQFESTVRALFSKERVKLEDKEVEKILDITKSVDVDSQD